MGDKLCMYLIFGVGGGVIKLILYIFLFFWWVVVFFCGVILIIFGRMNDGEWVYIGLLNFIKDWVFLNCWKGVKFVVFLYVCWYFLFFYGLLVVNCLCMFFLWFLLFVMVGKVFFLSFILLKEIVFLWWLFSVLL